MRKDIEAEWDEIKIPAVLHETCKLGVRKAEREMKKNQKKTWIRRVSAAAAVFVVCLLIFNNNVVADMVKGFFKDIVRFDGAITGTAYEVGMDEIEIRCQEVIRRENDLNVILEVQIANPDQAPFPYIDSIQVGDLKISDSDGNKIEEMKFEADAAKAFIFNGEKVFIELNLRTDNYESENAYILDISTLYGHSKADAPLEIQGEWKVLIE